MKVLKFGGTSVQNAGSIQALIKIVLKQIANEEPVCIVTSAMAGITDQLLEMALAAENGDAVRIQLEDIEARHIDVIRTLLSPKDQTPAMMQIKLYINELDELLEGVRSVRELSLKTRDKILSYGELCSTYMLCEILKRHHPKAAFVDTRKLLVTDDNFGKATLQNDETEKNIKQLIANNGSLLYCVTGFIASNNTGHTTTLGRGGSDFTAAVFGSILSAKEIEIWTDVDGFMSADPNMVKKAFTLPEISYTEAKELSYFGAKVIYSPAMIPAFEKKIPIRIRNTFNPEFTGTVIRNDAKKHGHSVRGISSIREVSLINIEGSGLVGNTGFSGRLFTSLSRYGVNVILITQASSEQSITLAVAPEDGEKAGRAIENEFEMELMFHTVDTPQIVEGHSIVAIVGENMRHTTGISGDLFHALGRNGINVTAIAQGSSEHNISVIVHSKDLAKTLNVVHDAFFLSDAKTLNVFYVGVGNIGNTLLQQIKKHEKSLYENNDLRIKINALTNSRQMIFNPHGFEALDWQALFEDGGQPANLELFIKKMKAMNLPNSVFIDNSASDEVVSHYKDIFASNISVVTCNKKGNSGSYDQYKQFKHAAKKSGVDFFYETNVGAGLPIIKTLQDLLISGDQVLKIEAILSGAISYVFNEFNGDKHFYEVVKKAQETGLTEPDPRDDFSGLDFMRKMLILARESGHPMELEDIELQSFLPESCLNAADIPTFYRELEKHDAYFEKLKTEAEQTNKKLRYIGVMDERNVHIELKAVDASHPFYSLSGSDNIIAFTTDRYIEKCPLVVKGPGAGAEVTAAGVFADLVKVGSR